MNDQTVTIAELLGHEDIKTTMLYLGLNMDDKSNAMSKVAKYRIALKRVNFEESRKKVDRSGFLSKKPTG